MSARLSLRRQRAPLAWGLAAVMVLSGATASVGAEPPPPSPPILDASTGAEHRLTLITGDVVALGAAGGRETLSITPAEGREDVTFQTTEVDEELLVIPSDAVPYLASGALDRRLFEVTSLIDDGYADRGSLPLIATYSDPSAPRAQAVPEATLSRTLESIGGAAVEAQSDRLARLWRELTPGETSIADNSGGGALAGGIAAVWLDGRVHATLEQSVAQTGAPDAWAAGFTGRGVEVAVLDTGVDARHPDLTDRIVAQRDFSGSASGTADLFGHGTHVASTIAGTGAGSDGRERGVAYEADLVIGKVLGDDGYGYESAIIAGMQWAVAEAADVVNMSLGGGATDGTDPLSVAVDALSEQSGTLFVVSAGNEGQPESVGTPGAAARALTVAAVDARGGLADFSSRGPRAGDSALKPDISAPGVDIVAARAAGTAMGTPVNDLYTTASGTSMASPHVAGAAALLAQQRPELDGQGLKELLMSSTSPSSALSVWEQGAGELDVTRAIEQRVRASGPVDFALVEGDAPTSRTVTFRNDGDEAVSLDLALEMRDAGDPAATSDAFAVPDRVAVPAHGAADVTVSIDGARLERGEWTGYLVATAAGGDPVVRTAVGALRQAPRHHVSVRAVGFDGEGALAAFTLFGDRRGTDWIQYVGPEETLEIDVEEGEYILHAIVRKEDPQDQRLGEIVDPALTITQDTSLVLDARQTREVKIRTPQPAQQQAVHSYYLYREFATGRSVGHGVMEFGEAAVWVTPTTAVEDGAFEFSSRQQMVRPSALLTARGLDRIPELNLLPTSPVFERPRTLHLAAADASWRGVRGRVAVVPSPDRELEEQLVAQAATAGAAAVILVRPEDTSIRSVFDPTGEPGPIPGMVTTARDGERLLALARKPGATVRLELSRTSPYLYDIQQVSAGHIPDGIVYEMTKANSHRIRTTYAAPGGTPWTEEQRFSWRPWQEYAENHTSRLVFTPSIREEWVSAGDSLWQQRVSAVRSGVWGPLSQGMTMLPRTYEPGRSESTWYGPVVRSAGVTAVPSSRTADLMALRIPEHVDSAGHYAIGETTASSARLFRDDALIAELPGAVADVPVPADAAGYRLELSARRDDPEWQWSRRVETSWDFRSARPVDGATTPLPLLHVSYDADVDESGLAPRRRHTLALQITDPDGRPVRDAKVAVWLSSDGGANWQPARAAVRGGQARVTVPRGDDAVSVRVVATASDDRRVEQTVIDAFGRG